MRYDDKWIRLKWWDAKVRTGTGPSRRPAAGAPVAPSWYSTCRTAGERKGQGPRLHVEIVAGTCMTRQAAGEDPEVTYISCLSDGTCHRPGLLWETSYPLVVRIHLT